MLIFFFVQFGRIKIEKAEKRIRFDAVEKDVTDMLHSGITIVYFN